MPRIFRFNINIKAAVFIGFVYSKGNDIWVSDNTVLKVEKGIITRLECIILRGWGNGLVGSHPVSTGVHGWYSVCVCVTQIVCLKKNINKRANIFLNYNYSIVWESIAFKAPCGEMA